jgi:3'(2'), 5'-bisphosphate nucleotidase
VTQQTSRLPAIDAGLIDALTALVADAARAILAVDPAALDARIKADHSPVTAADEASDAVIAAGLARLCPGVPVISEEQAEAQGLAQAAAASFVLVDPLDGTKEFIAGRDEYAVNLALVHDGQPVAGFIAAPARGEIYRGVVGRGAQRVRLDGAGEPQAIRCRKAPPGGLIAAISRSHLDPATRAFLDGRALAQRLSCGSALKFCRVAEGTADIYPRLSPAFEWDVAAGQALVTAAGGVVTTPEGPPLIYGRWRENFLVPGFVVRGDPDLRLD